MNAPRRDRNRMTWALTLNLIAPGAGLVLLRRDWLGLMIALLTALLVQGALWGFWIIPGSVPNALPVAAAVVAAAVWILAQWLTLVRARRALGTNARREVSLLLQQAVDATERGQFDEARDLLRIAVSLDDEDPELYAQRARLLILTGHPEHARRAWKRVIRFDREGTLRREAVDALNRAAP